MNINLNMIRGDLGNIFQIFFLAEFHLSHSKWLNIYKYNNNLKFSMEPP